MDGAQDVFAQADAAARLRRAWAESLCYAISQCHPIDASQIMAAALEDMETGGPDPAFGPIRGDAEWWAETAPQHELQEYTHAGMNQLAARALGPSERIRLISLLWMDLPIEHRRSFVRKVGEQ